MEKFDIDSRPVCVVIVFLLLHPSGGCVFVALSLFVQMCMCSIMPHGGYLSACMGR